MFQSFDCLENFVDFFWSIPFKWVCTITALFAVLYLLTFWSEQNIVAVILVNIYSFTFFFFLPNSFKIIFFFFSFYDFLSKFFDLFGEISFSLTRANNCKFFRLHSSYYSLSKISQSKLASLQQTGAAKAVTFFIHL